MKYILHNKFINKDFIPSEIAHAKKIVIHEDKDHPFLQVFGKDLNGKQDNLILQIPFENIKHTSIITQKQYRQKDRLIQIVYKEKTQLDESAEEIKMRYFQHQRLRIIRLDIVDSKIDEAYNKINQLRGNNSNPSEILLYESF
jgi:hypothetical protein